MPLVAINMVLLHLSAAQFVVIGLELAGFDLQRQVNTREKTNTERFMSWYGTSPESCSAIYTDFQTTTIEDARINKPNSYHFLMTLDWLKTYKTAPELAGIFRMDEKTARGHCWKHAKALQALKPAKITLSSLDNNPEILILTVDGVHFAIREPRTRPSAKWHSHKFDGPALVYEIAAAIRENRLVWINGPFEASVHDKTIYQKPDGLKSKMPAGKLGVADRLCSGEPTLAVKNDLDADEVKDFKRRARARHESINGRIKNFKILAERFRHGIEKHQIALEAICVLVQYEFENGHPLFDV